MAMKGSRFQEPISSRSEEARSGRYETYQLVPQDLVIFD